MTYKRREIIGPHTLYLGDCRDILPTLGKVDAVVTDPPYGVNLGANGPTAIGKTAYASYDDTPENLRAIVIPLVKQCIDIVGRVVLTPGTRNFHDYPRPDEMGAIFNPAGAGFSRWGFTTSQPIFYYGKDPYHAAKLPQSLQSTETSEKNGHPCPKPVRLMQWLVNQASIAGETVLDPFMGSGTTIVACQNLGRIGIGIEIDEKYFDIACKRVDEAMRQPDLFVETPKPAQQLSLLEAS